MDKKELQELMLLNAIEKKQTGMLVKSLFGDIALFAFHMGYDLRCAQQTKLYEAVEGEKKSAHRGSSTLIDDYERNGRPQL